MDSLDFRVSGELREILKEANQVAKDNGDKEIRACYLSDLKPV